MRTYTFNDPTVAGTMVVKGRVIPFAAGEAITVTDDEGEALSTDWIGQHTGPARPGAALTEVEGTVPNRVPTGSVDEVLSWVDGDEVLARMALDAEEKRPTPRKSLVTTLLQLVGTLAAPADDTGREAEKEA